MSFKINLIHIYKKLIIILVNFSSKLETISKTQEGSISINNNQIKKQIVECNNKLNIAEALKEKNQQKKSKCHMR